MKRGNNPLVLCLFGILPVVWLGLLIAPAAGGGLPDLQLPDRLSAWSLRSA